MKLIKTYFAPPLSFCSCNANKTQKPSEINCQRKYPRTLVSSRSLLSDSDDLFIIFTSSVVLTVYVLCIVVFININRAWRDDAAHSTVNTENSNLANFETVCCYFLLFCNHRNIETANICSTIC